MAIKEQQIRCPSCGESISIDDVLTQQIGEKIKKEIEAKQKIKESELIEQKKEVAAQLQQIEESKRNAQVEINKKVAEKILAEKIVLWKEAKTEAEKQKAGEMSLLQEQINEKEIKLREANEKELSLRKEKNKLEEDKKSFELEKQRQLDEERMKITEEARKKAMEEQQYNIEQYKKQIADATKANAELTRKLEQGSQQTQGEVLELELEETLKAEFPNDDIVPVPKGISGADIIQKVYGHGRLCGQIVWELKKTKSWNESWIQKLKDDQRLIKADIAVIVSTTLPEDVKGFSFRNGVWICDIKLATALAIALRINLESVTREKAMSVGKNEKMEMLYGYLTGVEFKQRVEAIVETFSSMDLGLKKERIVYEKIWAEREKQLKKMMKNTAGMYGDLNGMIALQQIKAFELEAKLETIEVLSLEEVNE